MGDKKKKTGGETAASSWKQENGCVEKGLSEPMRTQCQTGNGQKR